jgi:hypothetical protein
MNISKIAFTGIHSLDTSDSVHPININYRTENGRMGTTQGLNSEIHLKCTLTDDEFDKNGQDLGAFYDAMRRSGNYCNNDSNPYAFDLKVNKYILEQEDSYAFSLNFKVNGYPLMFTAPSDRKNLPILTFIAKLTSKLAKDKSIDAEDRERAKAINELVQLQGEHFIDAIM